MHDVEHSLHICFQSQGMKRISFITANTGVCWFSEDIGEQYTASHVGPTAAHWPDVEDEEETRRWDRQLQFTPVSDEVRHAGQQNVAGAEEIVCDYTSQHPLLGSGPLCACKEHMNYMSYNILYMYCIYIYIYI